MWTYHRHAFLHVVQSFNGNLKNCHHCLGAIFYACQIVYTHPPFGPTIVHYATLSSRQPETQPVVVQLAASSSMFAIIDKCFRANPLVYVITNDRLLIKIA